MDTGASISVFPHISSLPGSKLNLVSADGSAIRSWRKKKLNLQFGKRHFYWTFTLANVDRPILGADILSNKNLLVDISRRRLLDAATLQPFTSNLKVTDSVICSTDLFNSKVYKDMLSEFPEIIGTDLKGGGSLHGTRHHIVTSGPPVFARSRRLDSGKLAAAKTEFSAMEKAGIVRRSSSSWASPLHVVQKPDGSWRPCGDYRRLNTVTQPDRYPVPNIQDLSSRLAGCNFFSKLDLVKGYYQVPMAPEDIPKTAIVTPFGLYEFFKMPFGLRNAGQTFQRLMDKICTGLDFTFVYLDDVLIFNYYFQL